MKISKEKEELRGASSCLPPALPLVFYTLPSAPQSHPSSAAAFAGTGGGEEEGEGRKRGESNPPPSQFPPSTLNRSLPPRPTDREVVGDGVQETSRRIYDRRKKVSLYSSYLGLKKYLPRPALRGPLLYTRATSLGARRGSKGKERRESQPPQSFVLALFVTNWGSNRTDKRLRKTRNRV